MRIGQSVAQARNDNPESSCGGLAALLAGTYSDYSVISSSEALISAKLVSNLQI